MYIDEILEVIEYKKIHNKINHYIEHFEEKPESMSINGLMFGVKRKKEDTNFSWKRGFEKGALCSIISVDNITYSDEQFLKDNDKTIIIVDDVRKALAELTKYKRSYMDKIVIGITGSAGKTTTKDILHAVLSSEKKVAKSIGNKNSLVGLPITMLNSKNEEIVVLEMGMNTSQTIGKLSAMSKPHIAIVTNIGTVHLSNFNSIDEILAAKMHIVDEFDSNGVVVLNVDNEYLNKWYLENKAYYNIITFSINNESDYQAQMIESNHLNSSFKLNGEVYNINVPGECQIYNSLPAIILGEYFKLKHSSIKEALNNIKLSDNRLEVSNVNGVKYINDSYNANLDAMKEACLILSKHEGRKIACIGSMLDCGLMENHVHIELGKYLSTLDIDIIITVGNLTKYTCEQLYNNGYVEKMDCFHLSSNEEAIDLINKIKRPGDTILVKASGSMGFKKIVDEITN